MLLVSMLIFVAVTSAVGALLVWRLSTPSEQRLRALVAPDEQVPHWSQSVVKLAGPLARLSAPEGEWQSSPVRVRLLAAGIRHRDARLIYYAAKTVLPVALAALALGAVQRAGWSQGLTQLLVVLVLALLGCYLPNLLVWWIARNRRREMFESFPDAADLMLVCVEAGMGLDGALTRVAEEIRRKSPALAEELHLTNLEMRAGAPRDQALRNLALRTGLEEVRIFGAMLAQADKFGTSVGDSLRVFSDDLRHKRQVRAEEQAAKVPTKMLLPLVVCIFPAIIMVIIGPAAIQIVRTMMPLLAGRG